MNIPFISGILSYLQGDGAAILPEMELVLFGLGILLIDFWIEQKDKYWNAGLALAGTIFSGFTIFRLRGAIVAKGDVFGFHDSVVVDPFFIFFAALFRSEEHTSELQSRSDLVCRLLLEKKKEKKSNMCIH